MGLRAVGNPAAGGQPGSFTTLTVSGAATIGDGLAVTSGNLGIGYSTFSNAVGASGRKIIVGDAATSATPAAITVYSGAATYGGVYFADGWTGDQAYRGYVEYNHATDTLSASAAGGAGGWSLSATGFDVTGSISATDYIAGAEQTPPSAPAANGYRIFAQDNGAGKTQLMVIFASGAAQQIAIEP